MEALLAYFFSWYVLPSGPEDSLNPYVILLATVSRRGKKLLLPKLYLWSLYARLEECMANVVQFVGIYGVITHIDSCFLQVFLWVCQDGSRRLRQSNTYKPRVCRWLNGKPRDRGDHGANPTPRQVGVRGKRHGLHPLTSVAALSLWTGDCLDFWRYILLEQHGR